MTLPCPAGAVAALVVGLALAGGLAAIAPPARAQPPAAAAITLRGRIVDRATGAPVAGATITVAGELFASDDDGRFAVALAPGSYTIEVTAAWLAPASRSLVVDAAAAAGELVIAVEPAGRAGGERIEITDIAPTAVGETRVDAALARSVPGGGDAAKVVQSFPAVARPSAGSSEIVVWGAAPRDTRVFVDGVPVPALYHAGGYRAAVGNDLLADIRLAPAAFGPDRGRAIGGVIDIAIANPASAPAWRAQADLLDGALAGGGRVGGIALAAAARTSWLDRAIGAVADPERLAPNAPLPRWTDFQLAGRAEPAAGVAITGWLLGALDALDRTLVSDDPATQTEQLVDQRTLRAQLTVRRDDRRGFASATVWAGRDRARDDLQVGLIPARQRATVWVGGARATQQTRLADSLTLSLGLDVDGEFARHQRTGSLTIPAREGDRRIFGQPPGDDAAGDAWDATTVDAAAFAAVDLRRGRVIATLGGRLDGWLLGASRLTPRVGATPGIASQQITVSFDPRASVQLRLSDAAVLRLDAGRYRQARAGSDVSAVFGTPGLGLEQAWHAIAGGQWRRAPFALEAAGYARLLDDLVARDLAVTPLFARALTQDGIGRVIGAQLTARVIGWRGLSGWLSYNLSRSTRKDADSQAARRFDRDQTHGLIAVAGWQRGPWTAGGRLRLSTGEPRTGVIGALFDSRSGRFQPIRGVHNGERLPAFFAADLRAERRLPVGRARGAVYLEVQNLTGRANPEERIYSADFSEASYLTGLPLLALAGVRLER